MGLTTTTPARVWLCGDAALGAGLAAWLGGAGLATHVSPGAATAEAADAHAEVALASAVAALGSIDALVYLALTDPPPPVTAAAALVASGFLACAREAVRNMASADLPGNLVVVCDLAGVTGRGGRAAAAAASGALLGMVRALAKELGRQRVAVNALACGPLAIPSGDQPPPPSAAAAPPALGCRNPLTPVEAEMFAAMGLGAPLQLPELAATVRHLVVGGHGLTGQVLRLDHGLVI